MTMEGMATLMYTTQSDRQSLDQPCQVRLLGSCFALYHSTYTSMPIKDVHCTQFHATAAPSKPQSHLHEQAGRQAGAAPHLGRQSKLARYHARPHVSTASSHREQGSSGG